MTDDAMRCADDHPTADERLEMIKAYAQEQLAVARQAMAEHQRGSVQWRWGWHQVEVMTELLIVMGVKS